MAWSYCNCDGGLDEPTPEEVVAGYQVCPNCGKQNNTRKSEGDLILELFKRIEILEKTVSILIRKDKANNKQETTK